MFAIFEYKDKQYKAFEGDILKLPRDKSLKKNDKITFEKVIFAKNNDNQITIGSPIIKGATVVANVMEQIRDKKIIVFKKKRRHNYRRKIGHRQDLTLFKIEKISLSSAPKSKIGTKTENKLENNQKKEEFDGS